MDRNARINIAPRTNNGALVVIHFKDESGCYNYEPDIEIATSKNVRQLAIVITQFSTAQQLSNRLSRVLETQENGTSTENSFDENYNNPSLESDHHVPYSQTSTSFAQSEEAQDMIQNAETDVPIHVPTPVKTYENTCFSQQHTSTESEPSVKDNGRIVNEDSNALETSFCDSSADKIDDPSSNHDCSSPESAL